MTLRSLSVLFSTGLLLAACDGAATQGAAPPDDPMPATDDGGTSNEFCSGDASKFEWMGGVIAPSNVTSSRIAQSNTSDGAVLRFHVEHETGVRPSVMFRRTGNPSIIGSFDLGSRNAGIDTTLYAGATPVNAVFSGTAQFETTRSLPPGPVLVRVCATIFAPNSPFNGARIYVRNFPVMPWSWDDRLTIKLLANHNMNAAEAREIPLANIVTDPNPLVHLSSYSSVEQGAHTSHWDAWSLADLIRTRVGPVGVAGVPFVMEADGVPIYLGAFYGSASMHTFPGPSIDLNKMNNDGFQIEMENGVRGHSDPRDDDRILKVLHEAGKLLP
mgnify:CR=1 FL=1